MPGIPHSADQQVNSTFPRRRWLLALSIALLLAWMGFLIYLAVSTNESIVQEPQILS